MFKMGKLMRKFSKLILEDSFNSKRIEKFLVAIAKDSKDFKWEMSDLDFDEVFEKGEGDFLTCLTSLRKAADSRKLDTIGIVFLKTARPGDDIILKYEPKKKKWSLFTLADI